MTDTLGVTSTQPSSKPISDLTEIVLLLDETGSMSSYRDVTISSVNEYLASQRANVSECNVSLVSFSKRVNDSPRGGMVFACAAGAGPVHRSAAPVRDLNVDNLMTAARDSNKDIRPIFESENIKSVKDLSTSNYRPDGWTNLYDAIGESIIATDKRIRDLDHIPAVLFVIITDGEENSSRTHNLDSVRNLIKAREEDGWTFVYMGANQDAWKVGGSFGLDKGQTFTYNQNQTREAVVALSAATTQYRGMVSAVNCSYNAAGPLGAVGAAGPAGTRDSYVSRNFFSNLHDVVNNDKKD